VAGGRTCCSAAMMYTYWGPHVLQSVNHLLSRLMCFWIAHSTGPSQPACCRLSAPAAHCSTVISRSSALDNYFRQLFFCRVYFGVTSRPTFDLILCCNLSMASSTLCSVQHQCANVTPEVDVTSHYAIWNSLPPALWICTNTNACRHHLKNNYFQQDFQTSNPFSAVQ